MITLRLRKLLNLDKVFGENLNMIKTMCFEEAVVDALLLIILLSMI